jgi:hypothetical protein
MFMNTSILHIRVQSNQLWMRFFKTICRLLSQLHHTFDAVDSDLHLFKVLYVSSFAECSLGRSYIKIIVLLFMGAQLSHQHLSSSFVSSPAFRDIQLTGLYQ